jgi:hypothetical protein
MNEDGVEPYGRDIQFDILSHDLILTPSDLDFRSSLSQILQHPVKKFCHVNLENVFESQCLWISLEAFEKLP